MLAITVHSYRGGTGKTLLATNLCASYSKKEKVVLFDYDFRAPSLFKMFDSPTPEYYLNDYLDGDCDIKDVLVEVYPNLSVGFACPDVEVIREMMGKSRNWETEALKRTIMMRKPLASMGFEKIIFDSSPGLAYSSINAVVGSDVTALVMRMDALDILGTAEMVKGVYELLNKPTFIIVNMVLPEQVEAFNSVLKETFGEQTLAYLPCLCQVRVLLAQGKEILIDDPLTCEEGKELHIDGETVTNYSDAVRKLAENIEAYCKK
jgi:septum site-determining protein MinD